MGDTVKHISLASDENYLPLVTVNLVSLFETNWGEKFHIHLLINGVGIEKIKRLRAMVAGYGGELDVYPIANLRNWLTVDVPPTLAITTYARLFLCSVLPKDLDKVLYIDCDTMFVGSVKELFATDMGDGLVAGVLDPLISRTYKWEIGIVRDEPYLNAGVMLIPLNKWREEHLEARFIEYLVERDGKVHHHDQGIINAVCAGRKRVLPPQYNVMSNALCYPWENLYRVNEPFYGRDEYEAAKEEPSIIHFTGVVLGRPWEEGCTHPYAGKFLQYRAMTPYANQPQQKSRLSLMHKMETGAYMHLPFWAYQRYMQAVCRLSYFKHVITRKTRHK